MPEVEWPIRIAAATLAVGVVPGAVTLLAWRPRTRFTLLEVIGLGLGVGFGLIQLLTIAAMVLHQPAARMLVALGLWTAAHALVAGRHMRFGLVRVHVPKGELLLMALLAPLGALFYVIGSSYTSGEDQIHIAIVRRLAAHPAPALDNINYAPGLVYTYPFPATHYLMALMAKAGEVDALFLYHKLRAFWTVAACLLVYCCARMIVRSGQAAVAATVVAIALVANGAFAEVPDMYYGQLAPFSHASDVAMGVLLPALLLLSFAYLQAATGRERIFFLTTTLLMAFSVIVVHPREIVQFIVYLAAGCVVLLFIGQHRTTAARAAILLVATAVALVVYRQWHVWAVPSVDPLVAVEREQLRTLFTAMTWAELFGSPLPLVNDYIPFFSLFFRGWIPLTLLASPLLLLALRGTPLAWVMAGSISIYLVIVRLPVVAIPYLYGSYFEMLYTPVRNVVFFTYLLTGIGVVAVAVLLARLRLVAGLLAALAGTAAVALVYPRVQPLLEREYDFLFVPVLVGFAAVLVYMRWRGPAPAAGLLENVSPRACLLLAVIMIPLLVRTAVPASAAVNASFSRSAQTPSDLSLPLDCVQSDGTFDSCAPPAALVDVLRREVPVEGVLAIDKLNEYPAAVLAPQQMVLWPSESSGLLDEEGLFARYFAHFRRAMEKYGDQPLFNDLESREERLAFIRDLGVTHVLVDPRVHTTMSAVLAKNRDLFESRYEDGRWALYEVSAAGRD